MKKEELVMSIIWTYCFHLAREHSTRDDCEVCRKKSVVRDLSWSNPRELLRRKICSHRMVLDPREETVFPKEENQ